MCGIAGIWGASEPDNGRVGAMLRAMRHRGPDGSGQVEFDSGAAGMVRLALVDLSERGQQPMWSEDRRVAIIFNGEMYNFREERTLLAARGYTFRSNSDTEVVLALYLEYGESFVKRLRGMFALALFDWRGRTPAGEPRLLLARDPFGIKPLYLVALPGRGLAFASELRALLASGAAAPEVDSHALGDYLSFGFIRQPGTMLRGVRALEPATLEVHEPGEAARSSRFWAMPPASPRRETLHQAAERLRAVLDDSIRVHALADAKVGAFLSGGVDSTAVVGLMRRWVPDLRTYTLVYRDAPGWDEADEARSTAERLGVSLTEVEVDGADVTAALPKFAADLDQPSVDGLNTWLISRAAARDVRAVLSGLGGDEWFAGYPVTRRMALHGTSRGRMEALVGGAAYLAAPHMPHGRWRALLDRQSARRSPTARWMQTHSVFTPAQTAGLSSTPRGVRDSMTLESELDRRASAHASGRESAIGWSCLLDVDVYMRDQLLRDSDATSMAHSLELRVPFVDIEIGQFARSCADEHKLRVGANDAVYANSGAKRVLIEALRDVLPPEVASRPKRGFALPHVGWMQGPARRLVEEMCAPETVQKRGLLDPAAVAQLRDDVSRREPGALYPKLWSLTILELWARGVLDTSSQRQAAAPEVHDVRSNSMSVSDKGAA